MVIIWALQQPCSDMEAAAVAPQAHSNLVPVASMNDGGGAVIRDNKNISKMKKAAAHKEKKKK